MAINYVRYPHLSVNSHSLLCDPLLSSPITSISNTPLAAISSIEFERKRISHKHKQLPIKRKSIEVAAVYVEDAIRVRKPQTRIQEEGIKFRICGIWFTFSPLEAYKFVHNKWWKLFLYIIIWINFFYVHSSALSAIDNWILTVQFVCLICFIADITLSVFSHDVDFRHSSWQRMLYVVIVINAVHLLLLCMFNECISHDVNLLLQILRPYYLIYYGRSVRSVFSGILRSIPRIMSLVWVIFCVVSCFGWIGYQLLSHIADSNFNTFEDAMMSLMVLLTTANFPDVMMPSYHESQLYVLFFALYVVTILILFLPTLLAVIYEAYHSATHSRYKTIVKRHKEALWRAFELLTEHNNDDNNNNKYITQQVWMQFMRIMRPDLDAIKHRVLYTTLRLTESDLMCDPHEVQYRLAQSGAIGISKHEWLRLPEFIEIKFRVSRKVQYSHGLFALQSQLSSYLQHRETRTISNQIAHLQTGFRVYLLWIFSSVESENIIDWMVWINAMCFIAEKCMKDVYDNDLGSAQQIFCAIHVSFLILFVCEMLLKLYAFGCSALLNDRFFAFDACLVAIGIIGCFDAYHYTLIQLIRSLRLLRLLYREFPQMRLLMLFLAALMRAFVILLLAEWCIFYLFCMIGMVLFDEMIGFQQIKDEMMNYDADDARYAFWKNHLNGADATLRYYYLNNFNSFRNTMIVLMELSVVNNWQILMQMFITMSDNHYLRIFFISFYFCSVIVMLNVLIAFVINLFLVNYGQNISQNELLFRYKRYILMSILMHRLNDNRYDIYHYTIERRIRNALWYRIIFEQQKNDNINDIDYDQVIQMPFTQNTLPDDLNSVTKIMTDSPKNNDTFSYQDKRDNMQIFETPDKARGILLDRPIANILASFNNSSLTSTLININRATANRDRGHQEQNVSILSQTPSQSRNLQDKNY